MEIEVGKKYGSNITRHYLPKGLTMLFLLPVIAILVNELLRKMIINQPSLVFSWNKDNNNFVWLKMGKWVTKCSVNI